MTTSGQVLRVAAYGVVLDSAGRVLLARLTDRTSQPGWWTLPGGGLDHDEGSPLVHEVGGTTDRSRWVPRAEVESLDVVHLVRFALKELGA